MDNDIKIIEVNYGVANRFDNEIEINKHLIKYPELYSAVINHELKHDNSFFSFSDFKNDLSSDINFFSLSKFMLRHPSSLTQFFPIYWHKKRGIVYDVNLTLIYLFTFMIIGGAIYLMWGLL